VYEAVHTHVGFRNRHVALKILSNPERAHWFLRVARTSAALSHPHIVPVRSVGCERGIPYIVSDFVEGDDLQNGIGRRGAWSLAEVVYIVRDTAGALDFAHRVGIVHGYVHPRHILRGRDGGIWLIGFGECFLPGEVPPGEPLGNPLHLAPEQFTGNGEAKPRSDVYALSETAFWLLTGRHPYLGIHVPELMEAKRKGAVRGRVRESRPDVPPDMDRVLLRGMAPQAEARFSSAGEFADALAAAARVNGEEGGRWWQFWKRR
jgi:serine/threonine-protein kinase